MKYCPPFVFSYMSDVSANGTIVLSKLMMLAIQVVVELQFSNSEYFVSVSDGSIPEQPHEQPGMTIFTNHSSMHL